MSNSAARFSFAPAVKNNRFSVLAVDHEIRAFQDLDYVQCTGCGAYHHDAELSLHGECEDCVSFRHSDDFYSITKNDKALDNFRLTFAEANSLRVGYPIRGRVEMIVEHGDSTSTWWSLQLAS